MNSSRLTSHFLDRYGSSSHDIHTFYSPGRVNLIGDHTDYNGGLVFPCAVDRGTTLLARRTETDDFELASLSFQTDYRCSLTKVATGHQWADYPLGVLQQFQRRGASLGGLQLLFYGDLPQGAGLSSSAAVEVVTAYALNNMFSCGFALLELVQMSQAAEREFVGVSCGIMDQFAVAFAQEGQGIRLNCQSLEFSQVPLPLQRHSLVITNSKTERQLSESAYNSRAHECGDALVYFRKELGVRSLVDISMAQLQEHSLGLPATLVRRAHHVISEHERVIEGVAALSSDRLARFGQLMCESHDSMRDDFEVSTEPLDFLVRRAMEVPGTLGSRLTGAGFGGCTVSLVAKNQVDHFCQSVGKDYEVAFGRKPEFYVTAAAAGVREL